jgi:hypothetical protein
MRIAAVLSVRDEVELIEQTIGHLWAIGVDLIIACDMDSHDGTYEALEAHRSDESFWLFRIDDQLPDNFQTWIRANVALVKSARADWTIFLDADEYWLPASGSLKDCARLEDADVLTVDRFNVPLGPNGPLMPGKITHERYDELLLTSEAVHDLRIHIQENPEAVWIRAKAEAKVMARPARIGTLALGGHDVVAADTRPLRRYSAEDVIIAHLPFTTRARFARKVDNIRRLFRVHDEFFGELTAWHWRRWLVLADEGRLDEEFDRSVFDERTIMNLRAQGIIRSAAELLGDRMTSSVHTMQPL